MENHTKKSQSHHLSIAFDYFFCILCIRMAIAFFALPLLKFILSIHSFSVIHVSAPMSRIALGRIAPCTGPYGSSFSPSSANNPSSVRGSMRYAVAQ